MPGVGIADFGADFIKYLPGVIKILRRSSKLRSIPLGKMKWQGSKLVKKMEVGQNVAWTNILDGGALPPAKKMDYVEAEGYRRFGAGSVQVSDGILANASSTEGAAIKVVDSELRGLIDVARRYENYMLSRNGTGVVTTLGSTTSGATITVDDARLLLPKKDYEIRAATAHDGFAVGDVITSFTVQSVARALTSGEATVTLTASLANANQADGDYIVWGTGDYSAYGRAITGLDSLIDDAATTFQGVNCSTYPWYTSPVIDGGGSTFNITPSIFRNMQAMLKQESENYEVPGGMLVYTSVWDGVNVETMYENLVRLTPDSSSVGLAGGMTFKSAMGTITVLSDHDVPYGKMFFIDRRKISRPVQKELDWRRSEGGGIFERSDRFAGYTATCIEIYDLFIEERNTCGKIENLRVTPGSAY